MRIRRLLLVALGMAVVLLGSAGHAFAQEAAQLDGVVTLDGEPAPLGTGFRVLVAEEGELETECGRSTTVGGAAYSLALSDDCRAGSRIRFELVAAPDVTGPEFELNDDVTTVDVAFVGVPSELKGDTASEKALAGVIEAVTTEEKPLIEAGTLAWVLGIAMVGGFGLLGGMVLARWATRKDVAAAQEAPYRAQIEGMVLVMVVVAVIILGVTEKIGQEGLVSVLAAIAGYGAGKASSV